MVEMFIFDINVTELIPQNLMLEFASNKIKIIYIPQLST